MDDRERLLRLVKAHKQRLFLLEEKRALYGIDVPPHVLIEIEDIRAELVRLEAELQRIESDSKGRKDASLADVVPITDRIDYAVSPIKAETWKLWQEEMDALILAHGSINPSLLNLLRIPEQYRDYAVKRYYEERKNDINIRFVERTRTIELENAKQITAFFERWKAAADGVNASGRQFATSAEQIVNEMRDAHILDYVPSKPCSGNHLHGFIVKAPPLDLNIPPTFPLIFVQNGEFTPAHLESVQSLRKAMKATGIYFAFLVVFNGADKVKKVTKGSVYDVDFIILDRDCLFRILTARDKEKALAKVITEQASLTRISPYVVSGPVPERVFFGREKEINAILTTVKKASIALVGGRKIGKTSILHKVARTLGKRPDMHLLDLDCQKIGDYEGFFNRINKSPQAQGMVATNNDPRSFYGFVTDLQEQMEGKQLLFLVDEIDDLLRYDAQKGETLFGTFRSLSQERRTSFVFSGAKTLYTCLHDPKSSFFNFCDTLQLRYLDPQSAAKIITEPMGKMGLTLRDERLLVNKIVAITSGHPNLIQYMCQKLVEYLDSQDRRTITLEDLALVSSSSDFHDFFLEVVWGDATPLEKIITLIMAKSRVLTEAQIRQALAGRGLSISVKELKTALQGLKLYSILIKRGKQFTFVAESFPTIVSESQDVDHLIEQFCDEMEREA